MQAMEYNRGLEASQLFLGEIHGRITTHFLLCRSAVETIDRKATASFGDVDGKIEDHPRCLSDDF